MNIMYGEDYRSQALLNYHKIVELEEKIIHYKALPGVWKHRYLQLHTKLRRNDEMRLMELEEERRGQDHFRQEIREKEAVIAEM